MEELLLECQLQALNTKFHKRKEKLWTFQFPNRTRTQLGYILINSKWKNSVTNCEVCSSMAIVKPDHRIITIQVRISLRANIKIKKISQYDWKIFRTDENIKLAYELVIQNRCEIVENNPGLVLKSFFSILINIIDAHKHAANLYVPRKTKRTNPTKSIKNS